MEILSVSLKNFKSHSDRQFAFQAGTNAICGENGAGKTSILEAIAWVLFNYRGAYKNEDLIRNGANSAQVVVTFVSNRDQRTYQVSRCTRSGYTIYDPQVGEKLDYSRIDEEVVPWLRQQFGVAPGTDLSDLFANTIGVPQGLFTADFLKPDRERKKTFDTILKVDEYRKAFEDLLPLSKYAEAVVKALEKDIAGYEEALVSLEPLQQKRHQHSQDIHQVQQDLEHLHTQLEHLQRDQVQLESQALQLRQLESQWESLNEQMQAQAKAVERSHQALQQAEDAAAICIENRDAHQAYVQAEEALQALQQQWLTEQALQQQQHQLESQLSDRHAHKLTLTLQLQQLANAKSEIERLEPLVQHQIEVEQAQQAVNQQLQQHLSLAKTAKDQEKRLAQMQAQLAELEQEIANVQQLAPAVEAIPELEHHQQRYQQQLSRVGAAAQFEADLRQLLHQAQGQGDRYATQAQQAEMTLRELQQTVPLWSDALDLALTALHAGTDWQQHLMTELQSIVDDLAEQTSVTKLEQHLQTINTQLQVARRHQTTFANLERLLLEKDRRVDDICELQAGLADVQRQLAEGASLRQRQMELASQLNALDDPRGRIRLRQEELRHEGQLQTQACEADVSLTQLQQAIAAINAQRATFANLADDLRHHQTLKQTHQTAHERYWAYRELANTRRDRKHQLQEAIDQLQVLEQNAIKVGEQRDRLAQGFDQAHFQQVQVAYQTASNQQIALAARLPEMERYLDELDQQLAKLDAIQAKRMQARAELEQKRKVERFVKFARKAYKESGPRITERYVQSISYESDRLFRELLNRPNVALEWTRDYEILVQEGAHKRRFVNLSGGEQMCAALAVRLALLKVLADIDIAFFDEPTTNMDRPRRESLAEAIANIKTFRQLFVISHDDTFEKITENIIQVEREV